MSNSVFDQFFAPRPMSLSRRSLLRSAVGAAGLTLFPLLNQVMAQSALSTRRFVFFIEGNGVEPITMLCPSARTALEPTLSAPLGTLRYWPSNYRHSSVMEVASPDLAQAKGLGSVGDLVDRATVLLGLSSKVSGGGHSNFHGCLSCTKTNNLVPGGPTIDAILAETMAGQTPFDALRAGVIAVNRTLDFGVTALARGKASPVVMSPAAARNIYFAPVVNPNGFAERAQTFDVIRRGIDSAMQDFSMGAERLKLERYAESIDVLAGRHQRISQHSFDGLNIPELTDSDDPLQKYEDQVKLATAALIGGLTNVAVLPIGTSGEGAFDLNYGEPYNTRRHALHHAGETKTGDGGGEFADKIHTITAHKIRLMTDMARALAETPDVSGGDMLSNTVLVYLPDTGERHHSGAAEWPILLMGGESLGLKQGARTIIYPGIKEDGHRQLSNVWNTLGHLAGLDLNDFGAETELTRKAEGPLSELMS